MFFAIIDRQQVNTVNATLDLEPVYTYRGNTSRVLSLAVNGNLIYSGSQNGQIVTWSLPANIMNIDSYDSYDSSLQVNTLEAHSDAVWSLSCLTSASNGYSVLCSASSDGTIKIWDTARTVCTKNIVLESMFDHHFDDLYWLFLVCRWCCSDWFVCSRFAKFEFVRQLIVNVVVLVRRWIVVFVRSGSGPFSSSHFRADAQHGINQFNNRSSNHANRNISSQRQTHSTMGYQHWYALVLFPRFPGIIVFLSILREMYPFNGGSFGRGHLCGLWSQWSLLA